MRLYPYSPNSRLSPKTSATTKSPYSMLITLPSSSMAKCMHTAKPMVSPTRRLYPTHQPKTVLLNEQISPYAAWLAPCCLTRSSQLLLAIHHTHCLTYQTMCPSFSPANRNHPLQTMVPLSPKPLPLTTLQNQVHCMHYNRPSLEVSAMWEGWPFSRLCKWCKGLPRLGTEPRCQWWNSQNPERHNIP